MTADPTLAEKLFVQSCENGYAWGCANLGFMLREGNGVEKNLVRARELLQQACAGGFEKACESLQEQPARQDW